MRWEWPTSAAAVRGTDGLRIVDALAMPYIPNGNINAPVMMTAEKSADLILGNTRSLPNTSSSIDNTRMGGDTGTFMDDTSRGQGTMEIALIRHARPDRWEDDMPADPQLTEIGRRQAEDLADHLTAEGAPPIAGLHSSPMTRAVQTADALATRTGKQVHTDPDLVEYDHGMDFYVPNEEYDGDFQEFWDQLQSGWYGGRPLDASGFRERVVRAIDHVIESHGHDDFVVIVCHGGVVSAYLSSVLNSEHILFFEPDYTSISRVLVNSRGRRYLRSANESPHRQFDEWNLPGRVV